MKHSASSQNLLFLLFAFLVLLFAIPAFSQSNPSAAESIRGKTSAAVRLIVKFRPEAANLRQHAMSAESDLPDISFVTRARAHALSNRIGITLEAGRPVSDRVQVIFAKGISADDLASRLAADPAVEYAVEDRRRTHMANPNDPYFSSGPAISGNSGGPAAGQWYLHAPTSELVSSINAVRAWDYVLGSSSVVVAIIDTGVRPDHPDLASKLLPGYDMISDVSVANDGDGRDADPSDTGDWITSAESNDSTGDYYQCDVGDSSWHGTMTASLVGAESNNGAGMAGVAWGTRLLPVRVLGKCGGYDSDIIAGMNWAAGLPVPGLPINPTPAKVLNLSLGGPGPCLQSYIDAINAITGKANPATIVVSAGNVTGQAVTSPANCPGVIAVGGLRHTGTKVGFSAVGPEIALSAPAGNCVNTDAGSPCLYPLLAASDTGLTTPVAASYSDSFNYSIGTSFSAPLVAGTAALMLSVNPDLTPEQVKSLLQRSVRAFPGSTGSGASIPFCHAPTGANQLECYCTTTTCGAGMLDTGAALFASGPFPVYRFFNTNGGSHFFTISEVEKYSVINHLSSFNYEGIGFFAYPTQQVGTLPVHRFLNNVTGGHFFTLSETEKSTIINSYNWLNYEGVGFYTYPSQQLNTLPIHRFFNNVTGGHFFTINETEKYTVIHNYNWLFYEGVGFYAYH